MCGVVSGAIVETDLKPIYLRHLSVIGSTMGRPTEFKHVLDPPAVGAIHPIIDRVYPLAEAGAAQRRMEDRGQFGNILLAGHASQEAIASSCDSAYFLVNCPAFWRPWSGYGE